LYRVNNADITTRVATDGIIHPDGRILVVGDEA